MSIEIREYSVEVFAENMLLHGRLRSSRRLTDLANEPEPYIDLDDVHMYPYLPDALLGLNEHSHGMVNKASVVLMTELTEVSRAAGGADAAGARVVKDAFRVLVHANQFAINANVHLAPGVELGHMLSQVSTRFLPVTNATVTPTQPNTQLESFRRDFMLVNTEQISYLGLAEVSPPVAPAAGPDDELIG
jgi:hypothetical protein